MIDVKENFKSQYGQDLTYRLCPEPETQPHLLVCKEINDPLQTSNISYEDVFKDISKQEAIAKHYYKALKLRNMKLKEQNSGILSS